MDYLEALGRIPALKDSISLESFPLLMSSSSCTIVCSGTRLRPRAAGRRTSELRPGVEQLMLDLDDALALRGFARG